MTVHTRSLIACSTHHSKVLHNEAHLGVGLCLTIASVTRYIMLCSLIYVIQAPTSNRYPLNAELQELVVGQFAGRMQRTARQWSPRWIVYCVPRLLGQLYSGCMWCMGYMGCIFGFGSLKTGGGGGGATTWLVSAIVGTCFNVT